MEERPVPAPREGKRPVPTPRKTVCKLSADVNGGAAALEPNESKNRAGRGADEHFNTFSRRVRSASQQIAGKLRAAGTADINQLVQDRKKAVIEGTRQSVRRIRRRFSTASQERAEDASRGTPVGADLETALDIFKDIRFDSPINRSDNNVYGNVDDDQSDETDSSVSLPPPAHPPPPPPDESLYDAPTSLSSSGHNSRGAAYYEYVFPLGSSKSDSDPSEASDGRTVARGVDLSRSDSWAYYDSAAGNDAVDDVGAVSRGSSNVPAKPARKPRVDLNSNLSGSSGSSESKANSIYENHEVVFRPTAAGSSETRVSQSVLMQFDPLAEAEADDTGPEADSLPDIKLLEELLRGDLYGTVSPDRWSSSDESLPGGGDPIANPPTPPLRVDSLPEDDEASPSPPKSRANWFTDGGADAPEPKKTWFRHVVERTPFKGAKRADRAVERPALGGGAHVHKRGMLYKVQSGPVEDLFGEYSGRWCVLENSRLVCYSDNTGAHVKEHFAARNVLSVQALRDPKYRYRHDNDDLHCFEINTAARTRGGHVYGSRNAPERRVWMQTIAESLTRRFKSRLTADFARIGWGYVREGVSGEWTGAWLLLGDRELHYAADARPVNTLDLRKARCIVLQAYRDADDNPRTGDKGPNMLVDCPDVVLYLRAWTSRETKVWCHVVKAEAHDNGAHLDQQQLTRTDIPVVVDKCVNFVYAHGSMSEGIYRKSGQASLVADLLARFRRDAFAVQLTRNTCNEFEVATALKRFFRDLPEPLFGCDHRQYLHEVAKHNDADEKVRMFRAALEQLPAVAYGTARKLLGHLRFVANQSDKNRMTIENLAAIWGPTLLHYEDKEARAAGGGHVRDSEVVAQLLRHYRRVFPEDPDELEREKLMLRVLERHARGAVVDRKTAGDFRVWIFAFGKEGRSFNVAVGPNRTAYEVCLELADKIKTPVHELVLEEVVLGDRLVRPVHHAEKVLDIVLRWGYWDEGDRKDNYLVVSPLSKYWEYIIEKPTPVSGELRFADGATRAFRALTFQLSQGSLTCFKDKTGETVLATWRVEDIVWYLGHEAKRSPGSRWTVTFFEAATAASPRTRSRPYFGNALAWGDAASRAAWLGAMLKARHPRGFAPPPKLVAL